MGISNIILLVGLLCTSPGEPHRLDVNPDATFQTIDHFGASDCWSMEKLGAWPDDMKNEVAELLFSMEKGIGLSCWRFNLGAGLQTNFQESWRVIDTFETGHGQYDWARQPGQRWFLRAAKARGVPKFLAFVNSPPARMTRNNATRCTREVGSTNLKPGYEAQFAQYLCDILAHFRDNPDEAERIIFDYVSPVNEPHLPWDSEPQEGNRASNADIKAIVNALYDALHRQDIQTRIIAPEANNYTAMRLPDVVTSFRHHQLYGRYITDFCEDRAMARKLGKTLCAHAYWTETLDVMIPLREALRASLDQHPGWQFWQSEFCVMGGPNREGGGGRDLTMETALWVARLMHFDLTIVNAAAWNWWTAVSHCDYKDGLIYTDYHKPGDTPNILPAKLLWAFGNYSRFVRPGMVRVDLQGAADPNGLMASAYVNAKDQRMVVVLVNVAGRPATIQIDAPRPLSFTPYITTDAPNDNLRPGAPFPSTEPYEVPPRAVVTLLHEGV